VLIPARKRNHSCDLSYGQAGQLHGLVSQVISVPQMTRSIESHTGTLCVVLSLVIYLNQNLSLLKEGTRKRHRHLSD
jgi:hypothetical protein